MKSPQTPAKPRQTTTSLPIKTQNKRLAARSKKSVARNVFLLFLLLAAGALAALPGPSSATSKRSVRAGAAPVAQEVARASVVSRETGRITPTVASPATLAPLAFFFD